MKRLAACVTPVLVLLAGALVDVSSQSAASTPGRATMRGLR